MGSFLIALALALAGYRLAHWFGDRRKEPAPVEAPARPPRQEPFENVYASLKARYDTKRASKRS